jgi:hypothetical protein
MFGMRVLGFMMQAHFTKDSLPLSPMKGHALSGASESVDDLRSSKLLNEKRETRISTGPIG